MLKYDNEKFCFKTGIRNWQRVDVNFIPAKFK